jgi:hypothetical protein
VRGPIFGQLAICALLGVLYTAPLVLDRNCRDAKCSTNLSAATILLVNEE